MDEQVSWEAMVASVKVWAIEHLDQWDRFSFMTEHGVVYVSITRSVEDPDSFVPLEIT